MSSWSHQVTMPPGQATPFEGVHLELGQIAEAVGDLSDAERVDRIARSASHGQHARDTSSDAEILTEVEATLRAGPRRRRARC